MVGYHCFTNYNYSTTLSQKRLISFKFSQKKCFSPNKCTTRLLEKIRKFNSIRLKKTPLMYYCLFLKNRVVGYFGGTISNQGWVNYQHHYENVHKSNGNRWGWGWTASERRGCLNTITFEATQPNHFINVRELCTKICMW